MKTPKPPRGKRAAPRPFGAARPELDVAPIGPTLRADQLPPAVASAVVLLATLGVASLIGGEMWTTGSKLGFPTDDTFIPLRIAENLAQHGTFGLNPGENAPVASGPLWALLLALPALLGTNLLAVAMVLGAVSYVLCAYAAARLAQRLSGRGAVALFTGVATLLCGRLGWSALSGQETLAFTTFALFAIDASVARERALLEGPVTRGRDVGVGVLFGLAALLRPEGVLLFGLWLVNVTLGPARRLRLPPLATVLTFALLFAPWVLFCLLTTGDFVPATLEAKRLTAELLPTSGYLASLATQLFECSPLLALLAPVGVWQALRALAPPAGAPGAGPTYAEATGAGYRLLFSWALALPIALAVLLPTNEQHGRYLAPAWPLWLLLGATGLVWLVEKLPFGKSGHTPVFRLAFVALLVGGGFGAVRSARALGEDVTAVNSLQFHLGLWAAQRTAAGNKLAATEVGALSFLSKRPILDLSGLANTEVRALRASHRGPGEADAALWPILVRERPDYLVLKPAEHPHLTSRTDLFQPAYWRKRDETGQAERVMLVAYKANWERYTDATLVSAAEADARLRAARGEVDEGRAGGVWNTLVELENTGPLERSFRQRLYVVRGEAALARGDCNEARRAALYLDWLTPDATFRTREGLDGLERRAQACKPADK